MKLYQANASPFSSRVRICLYAKGLDVEIPEKLPGGSLRSDAYRALNPVGKIPCLELDDGSVLPESEVVVEYLEDIHPQPPLRPDTAEGRARARLLARIVDLYLYPPVQPLFGQLHAEERDEVLIEARLAEIGQALDLLEHYLDEDSGYAVGGRLSTADAAIAPVLVILTGPVAGIGLTEPFAARPKCEAYWESIRQDSVVARVIGEMHEAFARFRRG